MLVDVVLEKPFIAEPLHALNIKHARRCTIDFKLLIFECHYSSLKIIIHLPNVLQPLIFEPVM